VNKPTGASVRPHPDGEHVEIKRSGKRESESGVGSLFASA
jgi:hypothetical protein